MPLKVLAAILGTTWAWAVTGFAAGWLAGRIWAGPLAGMICLLIADLSYYWVHKTSGYTSGFDSGGLLYLGMLVVPAGVGMGLLGSLAAQRRWWSLPAGLAAPAAIVIMAAPAGSADIQPWPPILTWIIAAAATVLIVTAWAARSRAS